jgi:hypothetical protein
MLRKYFQVGVLVCLASVAVLYPAIESMDRWDGPGPASDSEIFIIAAFTLVGMILVAGDVLARLAKTLDRIVVASIRGGITTNMISTPESPLSREPIPPPLLPLRV